VVVAAIEAARTLAPLHNGPALATIAAATEVIGPAVPGVAVFDTAFHASMPAAAAQYAIPRVLARKHGIRRYGFHGIAHRYLAERWAAVTGRPLIGTRLITLQLGNGASVTAVADGRSVETSMGFTPMEGLVMGTRSGDIDPTVVLHLADAEGVPPSDVLGWLNTRAGLLGLSDGRSSDVRDLMAAAADGDRAAAAAIDAFCYRARKYLGGYAAILGGVDAVVFGGGIGEHQPSVRVAICDGLAWCGLHLDEAANQAAGESDRRISAAESAIEAWVIPVDEAAAIAADVVATLERS
jgi:acetate kinase